MLKHAIILTFRKLKAHLLPALILLVGLSVGYAWLLSSIYHQSIFGTICAIFILLATSCNGQPILNKKEFGLFKILGAHKRNMRLYLLAQAIIVASIATLLGLVILDVASGPILINMTLILNSNNYWLIILPSVAIVILIWLIYLRIFSRSRATIS
ncbi:FtsX-like permease family protein [Fulvivirga sp. RKSG066]|uniref:FtsX-like permease family protein n=1 Tax=Fulvivirga aurantia TaxID=2529383 RepID=UPI0012BC4C41|nr:FtsX-like permease family protein [Fulvivirga aurantia]MTI22638.1 FtsX-like permease family protein [Fulvivirga aurantia]